ncbi:MAG TPA: DUF6786 family protein [Spirochaetia bacterium]|nr:DUF6786 family protein [Spirochaetia bacterium]
MKTVTRKDLVSALGKAKVPFSTLESRDGWLIAAPALGARIMGMGIADENALWIPPRIKRAPWSRGGNAGGLRTWLAPEARANGFFFSVEGVWDVQPAMDPAEYRETPAEEGWLAFRSEMTVRTQRGEEYRVAVMRRMKLEESGSGRALRMRLVQGLQNAGTVPLDRQIGLWCIAHVPSDRGGMILIPIRGPRAAHPCYETPPAGVVREQGGCVFLQTGGVGMYKIGVGAGEAAGSIASLRPARLAGKTGHEQGWVLTAMRFSVDPAATYVDRPSHESVRDAENGDAVQVYNAAETGRLSYSELEVHAPAVLLAPGGAQEYEIEMTVAAGSGSEVCETLRETTGISLSL